MPLRGAKVTTDVRLAAENNTLGMLNSLAALCDDSRDLFATAATCTPSIFCKFGMWNFLVFPPAPGTADLALLMHHEEVSSGHG